MPSLPFPPHASTPFASLPANRYDGIATYCRHDHEEDNTALDVERFFELFLLELESTPALRGYYKFLENPTRFAFRRSLWIRRLQYVARHAGEPGNRIWEPGCGFGTYCLFLALNGHTVHGTTLEDQYLDVLPERVRYWSRHGDASSFTWTRENLFDAQPQPRYDRIVVALTLHHLEPIDEALRILRDSLVPDGKIVAIESNGTNLYERALYFRQRGFRRIGTLRDPVTEEPIPFGDENIRSLGRWRRLFEKADMRVEDIEYLRFLWPYEWPFRDESRRWAWEDRVWRRNAAARRYLFSGVNFVAARGSRSIPG